MSDADVDIWGTVQSALTSVFIAFYPFVSCLLYQIRHEMASNPKDFLVRKCLLVTCLISQVVTLTFLRDQYVWNEQISQEDEIPNELLCGLSIFLYYGIFEACSYYLIIMLIWDETESQYICTHQLNAIITQNIKRKSQDKRFYFSTLFKIYAFCISALTLIPSSVLPSLLESVFVAGIDQYRCSSSNISLFIGIANKLLFVGIAVASSIQLYRSESRHHISNSMALLVMLPLCTLAHCFAICNELDWVGIVTLDMSRKIGFVSLYVFTICMICNHLMMQAQAKQQIFSAARRISVPFVNMIDIARNSMRGSGMFKSFELPQKWNKVGVEEAAGPTGEIDLDSTDKSRSSRFSVAEITEDEYEEVMISQDDDEEEAKEEGQGERVERESKESHKENEDAALLPVQVQSGENVKVQMQITVNMNVVQDKIKESIDAAQKTIQQAV